MTNSVFADAKDLKSEFRGVWVATVLNIDWPSKSNLSAEKQKQEFNKILDNVTAMKMNAVVVQIRPTADALYKSDLNPWSEVLTGTQGKDPGYDPLDYMVKEAHKRNIEFHAWFNPFRVTNDTKSRTFAKNSVVNKYPSYVVNYGGKKYIDPGIPEAREFVLKSVMEVVNKYDIDGVHFDDYFYPYPSGSTSFPDANSFKNYSRGFTDKAAWRRDNINLFVKSVYENIKAAKPYVKFGISPFGVWRTKSNDPSGAAVSTTVSSFDTLHADAVTWVKNGWVDYIAPQIYWESANKATPYGKIFDFWVKLEASSPNVQLYIGQAAYKIGQSGWTFRDEMPNQIQHNRAYLETSGSIFYNYSSLVNNPLGIFDRLKSNLYKNIALVPPTKNPAKTVPLPVKITSAARDGNAVRLNFNNNDKNVDYFVIYRANGNTAPNVSDPANIVKIVRSDGDTANSVTDTTALKNTTYTYTITSCDRFNTESEISNKITVK